MKKKEELVSEILDKLIRKKYHNYGKSGKGGSHNFVLFYLMEHDQKALSGEICRAMGGSTPRVAVILRELEKREQIARMPVEDDKRKVCVTLTEKGRRKAEKKREQLEEFIRLLIEELSEEDAGALPRILDAIEKVEEEHSRHHRNEEEI